MSTAYGYVWRAADTDFPCNLTGREESDSDGRIYVEITREDGLTFVLKEQLLSFASWKAEQAKAAVKPPHRQKLSAVNGCFTVIQATDPPEVGKEYSLGPTGELKKHAIASISSGQATTIAATPENLVAALRQTTESSDQVLVLDSFVGAKPGSPVTISVVTEAALERLLEGKVPDAADPGFFVVKNVAVSARLKRLMQSAAWILIDADNPPGMPIHWTRLGLRERLKLLEAILPGISTCLRIEYGGSSARVVNGSGQRKPEPTHALVEISDPSMLDLLRAHVHVQSVLHDLAFPSPRYSRLESGKIVGHAHLTLIDWSTWVVGRLIFNAKPNIVKAPGYRVLGANPMIVNPEGGVLDIDWLTPPRAEQAQAYASKTGRDFDLDAGSGRGFTAREVGQLKLSTEIESNGKVKPLGDWLIEMLDADRVKQRCEAPFRASVSQAAFVRITESGAVFVFDSGTAISSYLAPLPASEEEASATATSFEEYEMMAAVLAAFERRTERRAKAAFPKADASSKPNGADKSSWGEPYMGVLQLRRRPPPVMPLEVFGEEWKRWLLDAAAAAACPVDYVVAPLLSSVSTLIGHARWAQAGPGWSEPPHLWTIVVGDSGMGKSPGADGLMRDVLPEIERRMIGDYPDRLREWQASVEFDKLAKKRWSDEVQKAQKAKKPLPPMPLPTAPEFAPAKPRLRQHDVTIEQVGAILATAAPKGVAMVRDEIAGWLMGMEAYNPAGRAFWLEAYGGRPYRVERRKHGAEPIEIERLAVSVYGGTQPDRLSMLTSGPDDGLFSRILWAWPNPVPFRIGEKTPGATWAIEALDRLRELDLAPGNPPKPIFTPLTPDAQQLMNEFGAEMEERLEQSGGLLRSAFGKARGAALRLSLVLEWLWCCAKTDMSLPPDVISGEALAAAATLVGEYFMPMAERVFGDAGATEIERNAATLARWVRKERPDEVHVRALLREVRLPGLRSAEQIKAAAKVLVEADWLREPVVGFGAQRKVAYAINPRLWGQ